MVGQGFPDPHADWLGKNLSEEELSIGGNMLMSDPDARAILVQAYRELGNHKNFINAQDADIADEVVTQINLVRSAVIYGAYGYCED